VPTNALFLTLLALAECRAGRWAESIAAAGRAIELRDGWLEHIGFILAMVYWRKGDKDGAAGWFDRALALAKRRDSIDQSLYRLWAEAAAMLGRPGRDTDAAGAD
jgi:hypothetical protein